MRTIGFINWKGGVGKTCIAINTAYALAESWGARVLFIDMDKQANASYWFGAAENKGTLSNILVSGTDAAEVSNIPPMTAQEVIQKTRYENIDLISGAPNLLDVNLAILKNKVGRQDNILKEALKPVQGNYDVCIVDNPPDSNIAVLNGLEIIDDVIALTLPNQFSLKGVEQLEQEIKNYNAILKLKIKIRGILVNQFMSTESCYEILRELRGKGYEIFPYIRGGLGNFLNAMTQTAEKNEVAEEKIIYLDIDEIETNPQNFYGLRNIEELAGLISVSKLIEPLTVIKKSDGKYKLISGHRRRAAVQKLLEDGIYTERKLPCIIKTPEKIRIEQESGEVIEFDEDAVEMLNLIASNRGQREERTLEEKLQEVKYLEKFARAIYNQKEKRRRGRFVNFFAEEILNISKSQLLRMNALEKLTPKLKQAIDNGKISETAALEIATLSAQEQEIWLEKILAGAVKGTVQEIQTLKKPIQKNSAQENFLPMAEKNTVRQIKGVPEKIEDPQSEAEEWIYQEKLIFYQKMYAEAKRRSAEESNELKAAQWKIRASVVQYNIEELKLQHKKQ